MADTRVPRSSSPSPASTPVNTAVHASGSSSWLTPERVAHAEFRSSFRGLDGNEVRSFLARVAAELRGVQEREAELLSRLEAAEERQVVTAAEPLDVQQVSDLLGQETARVLSMAREAAADIKARAETDAGTVTAAAQSEAERLRAQSEGLVDERRAEAEAVAAEIMAQAEAAAEQLRADAAADAERVRAQADTYAEGVRSEADAAAQELRTTSQAEAEVVRTEAAAAADKLRVETAASVDASLSRAKESAAAISAAAEARRDELVNAAVAERDAARDEGKRMVGEARAVRERILGDMARRRNASRQQLERVRAARERLLDAVESVRQGVTDVQAELAGSLVEAKLAGDRAARSVDLNELPSLRELEAEVRLARDTGLIDDQSVSAASSEPVSAHDVAEIGDAGETEPETDIETQSDIDTDVETVTGEDRVAQRSMLRSVPAAALEVETGANPGQGRIEVSPFNGGDRSDSDHVAARHRPGLVIDLRDHAEIIAIRVDTADTADTADSAVAGPTGVDGGSSPSLDVIDAVLAAVPGSAEELEEDEPGGADNGGVESEMGHGGDGGGTDSGVHGPVTGPGSSSVGKIGPVVPRRGSRRERSTRRTEDLFARLRAADDTGSSASHNGSGGVSALVGLAPDPAVVLPSDPIEEVTVLPVAPAPMSDVAVSDAAVSDSTVSGIAADVLASEGAAEEGVAESELVDLDPDRVALHTRDAVLAGPMRDLSRQLKLALSDQQNEMLQAQRNPDLKRVLSGDTAVGAPTFEQIGTALQEASAGELMVAWSLGRRSVREDDEVQAGLGDVAGEVSGLARRIVTLLQERLGEAEEDTGGWDVDRVRSAYREVRSQRLGELVEFNLYSAYAAGQLAAAEAGSRARWVSDACGPDCLDNALAGEVIFGEAFPTGHVAPPSFPGCRCCLVKAD